MGSRKAGSHPLGRIGPIPLTEEPIQIKCGSLFLCQPGVRQARPTAFCGSGQRIGGSICGTGLCKLFRIQGEVAQGVAFGTAAHVIGTSKATELSERCGAVGSLSLVVAGILTAVLLPALTPFF